MLNIEDHRQKRVNQARERLRNFEAPTEIESVDNIRILRAIVSKLAARGARVVFVRFPTSGERWEIDEQMYPRSEYWDRMAREVGGAWIHFKDYPQLAMFELPDTSHIDMRDKDRFTENLINIIRSYQIYRR